MPYLLTWESPWGYYVRFSGCVTPDDFANLNVEATSDARWDTARYAIGDFRGVREHAFDLDDTESLMLANVVLIGAAEGVNPSLDVALIIDDPGIRRLMEREIQTGAFPYAAEIFDDLDDARNWLAAQTTTLQHLRVKPRFEDG